MELFTGNNLISLAILLVISGIDSTPNSDPANNYKDAREKFDKLLITIANMNEKRLKALKDYAELDSYKDGNGILRQIKKNIGRVPVLSEEATKSIIYETLYKELCKGDVYLEVPRNRVMFRAGKRNRKLNGKMNLDDEKTRDIINKVLLEMICKKGIIRKSHKRTLMTSHFDKDAQLDTKNSLNINKNNFPFEVIRTYESAHVDKGLNKNKRDVCNDDEDNNLCNDGRDEENRNDDLNDHNNNQYNDVLGNSSVDNMYSGNVLRTSCWKKIERTCKKACKKARKEVCNEFVCSKDLKKTFKKTCKKYCKEEY